MLSERSAIHGSIGGQNGRGTVISLCGQLLVDYHRYR